MASNPLVTVLISELLTKWVKLDQQRTVLNFWYLEAAAVRELVSNDRDCVRLFTQGHRHGV